MSASSFVRLGKWIASAALFGGAAVSFYAWYAVPTEGLLSREIRTALPLGFGEVRSAVERLLPVGISSDSAGSMFFESAFRWYQDETDKHEYISECIRNFAIKDGRYCGQTIRIIANYDEGSVRSRRTIVEPSICK